MRLATRFIAPIAITVVGVSAAVTFAQGGPAVHGGPQVTVVNTEANPVPVAGSLQIAGGVVAAEQSGTWTVGLSDPVKVEPPTPITSGGQSFFLNGGNTNVDFGSDAITASALSIEFSGGAKDLIFWYQNRIVARFPGNGNLESINLALTRPIIFNKLTCGGNAAGICNLGWIGNNP